MQRTQASLEILFKSIRAHLAACFLICNSIGLGGLIAADLRKEPEVAVAGGLLPAGSFKDMTGKAIDLRTLAKESKGLVIAFHSTSCPVSRQYGPTLARLEKEIRRLGMRLVIVNPHETDKPDEISQLRAQFPPDVIYILDHEDRLTKAMGARSTTEAFLVDSAFTIVYRGAVDDQFGCKQTREKPTWNWLANAMRELSMKSRVVKPVTDPSGCLLETDANITSRFDQVTYHNRISRIILQNCLQCHHTGGVAPFSLENYNDVKDHRAMMRLVVRDDDMPPWPASRTLPAGHPGWENDHSLTNSEKRDLLAWLAKPDLPLGDPALDPLDYHFSKDDWFIDKPDLVVQLPEPIKLPAQGLVQYQVVDVDLNLQKDTWINQWELRPTDKAVVHHALVFIIPGRHTLTEAEKKDPKADHKIVPEFLLGYVPGNSCQKSSEDRGRLVPKGSRLRFQIHYVTKGEPTQDQLQFGFKFLNKPPQSIFQYRTLMNLGMKVPAGAKKHVETISEQIPEEILITSFQPHMHYRGKSMKYELIYPDNTRMTLLDIPNWDFNWQFAYNLAAPIKAPRGSRVLATAVFDNSADNINNPDPKKTVAWGPNSDDEMMMSGFEFITADGRHVKFPVAKASGTGVNINIILNPILRKQIFRFLDENHDGFVTRKELEHIEHFAPDVKGRPDRLDNLMNMIDINNDHRWDFEEFDQIEDFLN